MLEKSGRNIGALCKIRAVAYDKVAIMPEVVDCQLLGEVVLVEGAAWETVYFTRDTAHFVENFDGENYPLIIKFQTPKDSKESLAMLRKLSKQRHVVEITDMNGEKKIAGTPTEPCIIRRDVRDHGQNKRDSNHYNNSISLTRSEPVPIAFG